MKSITLCIALAAAAAGANPYFDLTPGHRWTYKNGNTTETITVLQETKTIDGVETRVVEDRESMNGRLVELTRDYDALDPAPNDLYYCGFPERKARNSG